MYAGGRSNEQPRRQSNKVVTKIFVRNYISYEIFRESFRSHLNADPAGAARTACIVTSSTMAGRSDTEGAHNVHKRHAFVFVSLCLSSSLFVSLCLSLFLFVSLCLSVSLFVFLSLSLSLFLFTSSCLYVFVSLCLYVFMSFCLGVFMSLCLYVLMSLCL